MYEFVNFKNWPHRNTCYIIEKEILNAVCEFFLIHSKNNSIERKESFNGCKKDDCLSKNQWSELDLKKVHFTSAATQSHAYLAKNGGIWL